MTVVVDAPFDEADRRTRAALADQGFGVLTEIDVRRTLRDKLGEDMEDYMILGACDPSLAHQALQQDRSIGVLLPCNVVVRTSGAQTLVQFVDPHSMIALTRSAELEPIAEEAARRLHAMLNCLHQPALLQADTSAQ